MTVYVKTTMDKYELIVAIGDSCIELAKELGIRPSTIRSEMSRAKAKGIPCRYKKIEIDED